MTSLLIHSGLGNQLFQWAYFNYLKSSNLDVNLVVLDVLQADNRRTKIKPLVVIQNYELKRSHGYIYKYVNACEERKIFVKYLQQWYLDFSKVPFMYPSPEEIAGAKMIYGFFQNVEMVDLVSHIILPVISSHLDSIVLPVGVEAIDSECIIHVRRGDLASEENSIKYGVLDENYYRNMQVGSRRNSIIVTDDAAYGEYIGNAIGAKLVLGPDKLNEWQTFKLMARAKQLVCSNSTFSWWAGYIARNRGSQVVVPSPFYKSLALDHGGALTLSGAIPVPSSFTSNYLA